MYSYFCLRFKSEDQWLEIASEFEILDSPNVSVDAFGTVNYDEEYKGDKSPYFHVNLAIAGERLPEKLMVFVVKPEMIKRTFNGAGTHEIIDKEDFKKTPTEKIIGPEVTKAQLAEIKKEPLIIKEVKLADTKIDLKELK